MAKNPNTIFEILNEWFNPYNLSDSQKQQYIQDVCSIIFPTIISKAQEKLSTKDQRELKKLIEEKSFEKIMPLIESKFSQSEWFEFLDKNIAPILDSYKKEVLSIE